MSNVRFDAPAKKLAKETGLDKLGQSTLKKLDADGDGVVRLKDAQKLVKAAGLSKDGVLGVQDRKRIQAVLGGASGGASAATASAPSSAVSAKAGSGAKPRKLNDGYMNLRTKRVTGGIEAKLELTSYDKTGKVTGQSKAKLLISGLDPAHIGVHHYDVKGLPTHAGSSMPLAGVASETAASAAGAVLLVSDKKQGLVLVDLLSSEVMSGQAPARRTLLGLDALAKDPTVKAAAKGLGLSTSKLSVELVWADTSTGFEDKTLSTLAFELRMRDGTGKSKKQSFSTYLQGNLKKGLAELSIEKLERGVDQSAGWLYPPSAGAGPSSAYDVSTGGSVSGSYTGGSETSFNLGTGGAGGSEWSGGGFDWTTGGGE